MIEVKKSTLVADVMTKKVIVIEPDETMDAVQDLFRKNNIHHLPVVEHGRVTGMVSYTDYLKLLHGFTLFKTRKSDEYNDAILRSLLVKEVMTKQLATLKPEDTLEMAAGFFRENLFHALPVVDDDNMLVGIITTYDLINYAYG
jgi:acetoin utilization protein AcuB